MRLGIRLILAGAGAALIGAWWSIDGLAGGMMNELLGGLIWKGPLLFLAGCGLSLAGYRIVRNACGSPKDSKRVPPIAGLGMTWDPPRDSDS